MLKVNKAAEPESFKQLRTNPRIRKWSDFHKKDKHENLVNGDLLDQLQQEVKPYMLRCEQSYPEVYLCPYCERKVDSEETHIEHIKPRGRPEFRHLEFTYANLLVSCNDPKTCGKHKDNRWEDTFINPVEEDPVPCFHYSINGKIREDDARVRGTVSILHLNDDALVGIRHTIFSKMKSYPKDLIAEFDKYFPEFPSFVGYCKGFIGGMNNMNLPTGFP